MLPAAINTATRRPSALALAFRGLQRLFKGSHWFIRFSAPPLSFFYYNHYYSCSRRLYTMSTSFRKRSRDEYDSDSSCDTTVSESNNQVEHVGPLDSTLSGFKVKRLSKKARLPKRGSVLAAGYDICSARNMTVPARGKAIVPTDLAMQIPLGTYGRIAPRSGLAVRKSIDVGAGVHCNLAIQLGDEDFEITEGDRIAQMVLERIITPEVEEVEELDETERGEGGFGSTGVKSTD
ncbi:dUTPase-like protein [Syncephalis plumigaleata]|nr:dUTPase-like protein [Syncephalis plumigaleata]